MGFAQDPDHYQDDNASMLMRGDGRILFTFRWQTDRQPPRNSRLRIIQYHDAQRQDNPISPEGLILAPDAEVWCDGKTLVLGRTRSAAEGKGLQPDGSAGQHPAASSPSDPGDAKAAGNAEPSAAPVPGAQPDSTRPALAGQPMKKRKKKAKPGS